MKLLRIVIFVVALLAGHGAMAQLANTKWVGTFQIPAETNCIFHFKKDTMNMLRAEDNLLLEEMTYTVSGDTLSIKKLSGGSPCDSETTAEYRWKIDESSLMLKVISDPCTERSGAGIDGAVMTKIIDPGSLKKD